MIERIEEFLGMTEPKEQAVLRTIKRISIRQKEIPVTKIAKAHQDTKEALISLRKQGEIFEPRKGWVQLI